MTARRPVTERFWPKVDKRGPHECWPWKAGTTKGYGTLGVHPSDGFSRRQMYAHRLSWQFANGISVPAGMLVCHSCDNPLCCNPRHLWIGTIGDNNRDMNAKKRSVYARLTHCKRGHEYTPENTRMYRGGRRCRRCETINSRIKRAKHRSVA